jgi:hypothetical protein
MSSKVKPRAAARDHAGVRRLSRKIAGYSGQCERKGHTEQVVAFEATRHDLTRRQAELARDMRLKRREHRRQP